MTKEEIKDLKKSVKKRLLNKNLGFSCFLMLLKYSVQMIFVACVILLVSSFINLSIVETFTPEPLFEIKNSHKHMFIIFLCPTVLLMYFFMLFLKLGIKRWYYLISKDSTASFLEVFFYFREIKSMLSAIKLKAITALKLAFKALILIFLPSLFFVVSSIKMQTCMQANKILFACLMVISVVTLLIGMIHLIRQVLIYKLSKVMFFKYGAKEFSKGIKKIKFILKKNKFDSFKFLTYLLCCFLSCIFILPALVAVPYFYMMLYAYTDAIIENNNEIFEPKYKFFYVDINTELNA